MDVNLLQTHVGVQLASGIAVGPGTLVNLYSGSGVAGGSLAGRLADASDNRWAHGFALTSGSGTKSSGIAQKVRIDRVGRVTNVTYLTMTPGQTVYLGEDGKFAISGTQKVGFVVAVHDVFIDLDMQLGA
jgi:hypothetical protein